MLDNNTSKFSPVSALGSVALSISMVLGLSALAAAGCAHHSGVDTANTATRGVPMLTDDKPLTRIAAVSHTASVDGVATAKVRVCVAPSGVADSVQLDQSSGSPWFDRAAVEGLSQASYQSYSAPDHVRVCAPVEVVIQ